MARYSHLYLPGMKQNAKAIYWDHCELSFFIQGDDNKSIRLTSDQAATLAQFIARCLSDRVEEPHG